MPPHQTGRLGFTATATRQLTNGSGPVTVNYRARLFTRPRWTLTDRSWLSSWPDEQPMVSREGCDDHGGPEVEQLHDLRICSTQRKEQTNDILDTFYLRFYGVWPVIKDHSDSEIAFTMVFVTPVMEQWLEWEIAQWVHREGSIRRPICCPMSSFSCQHSRSLCLNDFFDFFINYNPCSKY